MVDPNIKKKADDIRTKIKGKEVREALASGIEDISEDVVQNEGRQSNVEQRQSTVEGRQTDVENRFDDQMAGNTDVDEVIDARRPEGEEAYPTLRKRLDEEHQEITAQLAQITVFATDFGAKFNGVDDDAASINRAIKHVGDNGGGKVILPKGTGVVSSSILMQSQVELVGQGRDVTFIKPTFDEGEVITAETYHKQKPIIRDLTIKPDEYQYQLIGISYKYFQYGTVERVDVFNCGISFDFNGEHGCYYNKQVQTRAVSTGIGVRTAINDESYNRPNSNEITDFTVISPIIAVEIGHGNSNKFYDVKVESLETVAKHPFIQHDGTSKGKNDRWVLVNKSGYFNYFEKFRAEFDGNLVDLGTSYGSFLKDFFMNFNGERGEYIELKEEPTTQYQTNDLDGVFLGNSLPVLTHRTFIRKSRLSYKPILPPQVQFTPRDYPGEPITHEKKGHVQFSSDGRLFYANTDSTFREVDYVTEATNSTRGKLKFHKETVEREEFTVPAREMTTVKVWITGINKDDTLFLTSDKELPKGLLLQSVYPNETLGEARATYYNATDNLITVPKTKFTFTLIRK